ncbi:hypothetical protein OS493_020740 [Desmophyllum pertusum]|uniref:HECT-type E3 ubiquitin transferase n=1 Tax=Desmophyllum pertusum TaxID=174260 RepID=A0A9X0CK91_9CNID|nr:hypothetical protein OS493_020740 [Desmophyllum pertusum]
MLVSLVGRVHQLVSQFKLETSIKDEVAEFAGGLNEVIPREFLSLFTADEFSLLIGGVTKLDVEDWKKHTVYNGCSLEDDVIKWFWNIVAQLKEEEKALPHEVFHWLALCSSWWLCCSNGFVGTYKIHYPEDRRTQQRFQWHPLVFNMLKLTSYSSEKHLKDKTADCDTTWR